MGVPEAAVNANIIVEAREEITIQLSARGIAIDKERLAAMHKSGGRLEKWRERREGLHGVGVGPLVRNNDTLPMVSSNKDTG